MTYELKPEPKQNRIIFRHPKVVEYVLTNCKALKCTPDEFILKLINNMAFLVKSSKGDKRIEKLIINLGGVNIVARIESTDEIELAKLDTISAMIRNAFIPRKEVD